MSQTNQKGGGAPCHVAIIMDGNGRWAQRRFLPRAEGHRRGVRSVRRVIEAAAQSGEGLFHHGEGRPSGSRRPEPGDRHRQVRRGFSGRKRVKGASFMEFVRLEYQNSKVANAELKGHREVILSYAEKGYRYAGFLPVVEGPSGKTLAVDLIFEKAE